MSYVIGNGNEKSFNGPGLLSRLVEILRVSLGTGEAVQLPPDINWQALLELAKREGVVGHLVDGVNIIADDETAEISLYLPENRDIKKLYFSAYLALEKANEKMIGRAAELTDFFRESGISSCILKGVGMLYLYRNPMSRQVGDIDIWVDTTMESAVDIVKRRCGISHVTYHHFSAEFFGDTEVEVHYRPAWLYNPFQNRKLQRYFSQISQREFMRIGDDGYASPDIEFYLVFSAVHIYKHLYERNVRLKQFVDYFHILTASTKEQRSEAFAFLCSLGLADFAGYLMWLMKRMLNIEVDYMLCTPVCNRRRPVGEMIWLYPWKIWHWMWRRTYVASIAGYKSV